MTTFMPPGGDKILRLSDFLPYRLSVLSNTISRQLAEIYEREYGLSVWQWRVLALLGEMPGLSAKSVAAKTAMDKVAVSRAVSGLIEKKYLKRQLAEDDGRRSTLRLSRAGETAYRQIAPMVKAREAELVADLSPAGYKALLNALDTLAQAASPDRPLW